MRGIAAVCIVIFHLKGYTSIVWGKEQTTFSFIPSVLSSGVQLFFCISGFLMAYLLMNNSKDFLKRRFLRIYPPYFIAVLMVILIKILLFDTFSINNLGRALTLLPFGRGSYVLNIEWTLIYEIFFYAICSFFAIKNLCKLYPYFLVIWAGVITLCTFYLGIPTEALPNFKLIFFAVHNYFFIAGGLSYFLYCKVKNKIKIKINLRIILIIVLIGCFNLMFYNILIIPKLTGNYRFPVFAILIAGMLLLGIDIPVKANNFCVKLGDYSYGMYLIHAQVLFIIMTLYKNKGYSMSAGVGGIAFLCALIIGWNFGRFEVCMHRKLKKMKWNVSIAQKLRIITVGMLFVVCISIFILQPVENMAIKATTQLSEQQAETSKAVHGEIESLEKVTESAEFSSSKVIKREATPGWVDYVSAKDIEKKATLELRGWTVDTEQLIVPRQVVAVCDGKIVNAQLSWHQRQGVADLFKTNAVQNCGWKLIIKGEALKEGNNQIDVYALLDGGNWISLRVRDPIEVRVSY